MSDEKQLKEIQSIQAEVKEIHLQIKKMQKLLDEVNKGILRIKNAK